MSRTDPILTIETWLAEGPMVAPARLVEQLPPHLARTRQQGVRGMLRFAWIAVPVAAAFVTIGVLLSTVLAPPVGERPLVDIPSPPAPFEEGDRVDVVLLIANLSDRPQGAWHQTGSSGSVPTAMPCHAVIGQHKLRAPAVVRFGEVDPETDLSPSELDSLPAVLDTASLPGQPVAYRDDVVPVWTYAYRISVTEGGAVAVEPLDSVPSLESAGPLCPVPDMSWPGGWPAVQAWLADRPTLPDCGTERVETSAFAEVPPARDTQARQCLYDAWLAGEGAQFVSLTYTDTGPVLEVYRTSDGALQRVHQQLRSEVSDEVQETCWGPVQPSESPGPEVRPGDDLSLALLHSEPVECP